MADTKSSIPEGACAHTIFASPFERIISTHPPILESLILQLPTYSILDLYHTSKYLRFFLQSYPLAWNTLSFRSRSHDRTSSRQPSPASDVSGENPSTHSKPFALDQLLYEIIIPFGTRLSSLDVDNTAVSGLCLTSGILNLRRDTLRHLSVRGCKNVSLKYHILPYLTIFSLQKPVENFHLALKSLYTYRCRHHRRRPYTTASLSKRDSDAEPTHELIKICKDLGIWTDTAWCPTPGGRCLRRKDYSLSRGAVDGRTEVWVVFDRLWRSGNWLGSVEDNARFPGSSGRLWENLEYGCKGEPLDCWGYSDGKIKATHRRESHKKFVEHVRCHNCGSQISERCEQCSVRMHCIGCRKTLCGSCAFVTPLPGVKPQNDTYGDEDQSWWSPGQSRNPNLLIQEAGTGDNSNIPSTSSVPALKMQWCCVKPLFSNGGGISVVGPGLTGKTKGHLRAAPLPSGEGYEDSEFDILHKNSSLLPGGSNGVNILALPSNRHCIESIQEAFGQHTTPEERDQMLHRLLRGPDPLVLPLAVPPCPRNLCQQCWSTTGWRAACQACSQPFCFAHDFRGFSVRVCGYRDLATEDTARMEAEIESLKQVQADLRAKANADSMWEEKVEPQLVQEKSGSEFLDGVYAKIATNSHAKKLEQQFVTTLGLLLETPSDTQAVGTLVWPRIVTPQFLDKIKSMVSNTRLRSATGNRHASVDEQIISKHATVDSNDTDTSSEPPEDGPCLTASNCNYSESSSDHIATLPQQSNVADMNTVEENLFNGSIDYLVSNHQPSSPPTAADCYDLSPDIPSTKTDLQTAKPPQATWLGCAAFLCPKYRSPVDHRPRCPAEAKQCTLCDVHVCPACLIKDPPCDCSPCMFNYRCPRCCLLMGHLCKKAEEEEEKRLHREKEERREKMALRGMEMAGEFWRGLLDDEVDHSFI